LEVGRPPPAWLLLQVFNSRPSIGLLGLGVGAMGQPVSHPLDSVGEPVGDVRHVHWDLPRSGAHIVLPS
jgi:hypothetical protein